MAHDQHGVDTHLGKLGDDGQGDGVHDRGGGEGNAPGNRAEHVQFALSMDHAVAGAAAGLAVDAVLYPLDSWRTRLQAAASGAAPPKQSLLRASFRGVSVAAATSMPTAALFFSVYNTTRDALQGECQPEEDRRVVFARALGATVVASGMGEAAACLVRVPSDNIKQRAQAGVGGGRPRDAAALIMREWGPRGFLRGYATTLRRDVPFAFLQFPLYEAIKAVGSGTRLGERPSEPTPPWLAVTAGSVAGGGAAWLTTPLDVVKTRIMTAASKADAPATLVAVARAEGIPALWTGGVPRCLMFSLGGAVFFSAYETVLAMVKA